MASFALSTLTGNIDGVNAVFTFVGTPTSVEVYKNGQLQKPSGGDFTLTLGTATATISFASTSIPQSGDWVSAWVFNQ